MDNRKVVLELKDVPPPPPPPQLSPRSQLSQSFSLASLSLPPPCLLPPPQLAKESHQNQPLPKQQQGGLSPKVSICTHCDFCSTDGYGLLGGRGVVGSISAGTSTFPTASSCQGAPIKSSNNSRFESCSVASSVHQYNHNLSGNSTKETKPLLSHGFKPQLPSSVATSQPLSLHPYFPCCSGLRHNSSAVPLACSQPGTSPSSASLASSVSSLSTPLLGPCLASSGFNTCGVNCNPSLRASQGSAPGDLPTTTTVTSTTSAHRCSNSLHLNVGRTVCGTRARFCQECLMIKVGSGSLYLTLSFFYYYVFA